MDFGDENEILQSEEVQLFGTNDMPYLYSKSIFGRIEVILENENMDKYSDDGRLIISPISKKDIEKLFEI